MPDVLSPNVGRSWLADKVRHQNTLLRIKVIRIIFQVQIRVCQFIWTDYLTLRSDLRLLRVKGRLVSVIIWFMNNDRKLDACGLTCPLPLLKAKQTLNGLDSGLVLEVVCTDPGSVRDFKVFAKQSGNELLRQEESDGQYTHWLKKA